MDRDAAPVQPPPPWPAPVRASRGVVLGAACSAAVHSHRRKSRSQPPCSVPRRYLRRPRRPCELPEVTRATFPEKQNPTVLGLVPTTTRRRARVKVMQGATEPWVHRTASAGGEGNCARSMRSRFVISRPARGPRHAAIRAGHDRRCICARAMRTPSAPRAVRCVAVVGGTIVVHRPPAARDPRAQLSW